MHAMQRCKLYDTQVIAGLEVELNRKKEEAQRVLDAHEQTQDLLRARTAELQSAQVFLTRVDRYAGSEVLKMIEGLNEEIFTLAAHMGESFQYNSSPRAERREETPDEETLGALQMCMEVSSGSAELSHSLKTQSVRVGCASRSRMLCCGRRE